MESCNPMKGFADTRNAGLGKRRSEGADNHCLVSRSTGDDESADSTLSSLNTRTGSRYYNNPGVAKGSAKERVRAKERVTELGSDQSLMIPSRKRGSWDSRREGCFDSIRGYLKDEATERVSHIETPDVVSVASKSRRAELHTVWIV